MNQKSSAREVLQFVSKALTANSELMRSTPQTDRIPYY